MNNKYLEQAKKIRKAINTFAKNQTDEVLLNNKMAFPVWNGNGINVVTGQIFQYQDNLYRVIQSHTTQVDWTPEAIPALFAKISLEEYPDWVQPLGAQDAYHQGDKCTHNSKKWISNVNDNVWEPGVYGWTEV